MLMNASLLIVAFDAAALSDKSQIRLPMSIDIAVVATSCRMATIKVCNESLSVAVPEIPGTFCALLRSSVG